LKAVLQGVQELQPVFRQQALRKQAARWRYDLQMGIRDFFSAIFLPLHLSVIILAVIFSIFGLCAKEAKTWSFKIALFLNGFAIFSTLSTLMMIFSGGHPVRQMSQGNYDAWSAWLHFFPIPLFGMLAVNLISYFLVLLFLILLVFRRREYYTWGLFFYLLLTVIHAITAINWLIMFMPDA